MSRQLAPKRSLVVASRRVEALPPTRWLLCLLLLAGCEGADSHALTGEDVAVTVVDPNVVGVGGAPGASGAGGASQGVRGGLVADGAIGTTAGDGGAVVEDEGPMPPDSLDAGAGDANDGGMPDAGGSQPDAGPVDVIDDDAGTDDDAGATDDPPRLGRLRMTRTRYLSSEKIEVYYVDVIKPGHPFIGIYERFGAEPRDDHDVKFGKDEEIATGSKDFKEQPAGTYFVRLVYDDSGVVADEVMIQVVNDEDGDGVEDRLDGCPDDEDKTEPGDCGCGERERDGDEDGVADCVDLCKDDPLKYEPGTCGCGFLESFDDQDSDGISDCYDGCPGDPNKSSPMQCGCGWPETDTDRDGRADCDDKCPNDPNKVKPGDCGCGRADTWLCW